MNQIDWALLTLSMGSVFLVVAVIYFGEKQRKKQENSGH